ncbi:replication initiator protein A [Brucella sp. BE17]|uniref:replication initiator protein A n=1 Tax=Brucella sp. BE17 TaxID=3142977 RepID=UPI0031B9EB9F
MAIKPEGLRQIDASTLLGRIESARGANAAREQPISQGAGATGQNEFDSHATINSSNISTVHEQMARLKERDKALSLVRNAPKGDDQADFFVPGLFDVGGRDNRSIMDVAPFRLSKRDKRAGEVIRHELPDGYVEVKSGPDGMASVWDYDIVLMTISHLTEAVNRWRDCKGEKPSRTFTPHVSDILKFARRGDGSRQVEELEAALDRLKGTTIKTVRDRQTSDGKTMREVEAEGLISSYRVVSRTDTKKLSIVEIEAPKWIYREIVEGKSPDVLTVHPDYFLIDPGIGRFLYRLARRAAGRRNAKWSFRTLYARSGSTGKFKDFSRHLRKVIAANDLPEYLLREEPGKSGPQVVMIYREMSDIQPPSRNEGG